MSDLVSELFLTSLDLTAPALMSPVVTLFDPGSATAVPPSAASRATNATPIEGDGSRFSLFTISDLLLDCELPILPRWVVRCQASGGGSDASSRVRSCVERSDIPARVRLPGCPDRSRRAPLAPEVALVRAQLAALEPRWHPPRDGPPRRVRPLADPGQRAGGAARGAARGGGGHAVRAQRLAHRAGRRPHPHRRRLLPQHRGDGGRDGAGGDRRPLHVRQRLLRHRRRSPLRRPRHSRSRGRASPPRARRGSATTCGAGPTSSSRAG